jgi:2-polyprenyl-3-methyl-5-hydroxy-6-metoxy-1,4-benzoquinol methylase
MKQKIINDFKGLGEMVEIPCSRKYCNGQSVHVCKETGLVRSKELRSAQEIANSWSVNVYSDDFGTDTYTARVPAVKARQTYVADFADVNIGLKNKMLCDIGAGEGQFLEIITGDEYQAKAFGIEPSEKNCNSLSESGFNNFNGTIEDYAENDQYEENKFDVITIMWTLVNSYSCLDMVNIAYKMLKPGGYLVVAEGSRILVPFKKPLHMYFSHLPVDLHPYHFSANSLTNLLKVNNFKIEHINRYMDSDILCIIGEKKEDKVKENYEVDDYKDVLNFFDRWDKETELYYQR